MEKCQLQDFAIIGVHPTDDELVFWLGTAESSSWFVQTFSRATKSRFRGFASTEVPQRSDQPLRPYSAFDLHSHQALFLQFSCREGSLFLLISMRSPVVRRDGEKFANWTRHVLRSSQHFFCASLHPHPCR